MEDRLGIEFEFERVVFGENRRFDWWRITNDPSLRNKGAEFVSHPLLVEQIPLALMELDKFVESNQPAATLRCGTHFHWNVAHKTFQHLWNLTTIHTLLEPTIFRKYAFGREENHFCVPSFQNTDLIENLQSDIQLLRTDNAVDRLQMRNCNKYSALNFAPIANYGTIEFRYFPGTRDMVQAATWIQLILDMDSRAREFVNHVDILNYYEDVGWKAFAAEFGITHVTPLEQYIEDAETAAWLLSGYEPIKWQELNWETNKLCVE
jgi:hypothetical protein